MSAIIPKEKDTQIISEGGKTWPLSDWRWYYFLNVKSTRAISHDQFVAEFPRVTEALVAVQEAYEAEQRQMADVVALAEAIKQAGGVAKVLPVLQEMMTMTNPQQPPIQPGAAQAAMQNPAANPMPGQQAGADTGQNANGLHAHKIFPGADGNGTTDDLAGHSHLIQGGKCMPGADGHVHEMPDDGADNTPPQVPNAAAQPPPFKAMGNGS